VTVPTQQRTPAATAAVERHTRRPTGKPSWPILLIAGGEKAGKSYSSAQASASDLIGRTLWVGIGEDDPDEYGLIPGADFEIVEHDGTYRDILAATTWATQQASPDGRPVLVVLDSASRLWDLLCDMAQEEANERARRKAEKERRPPSTDDADISMLEWNVAAGRWANVIDALRDHQGPSIVTARLEEVTVVERGKPTTEKRMKVKAHKSLPYDVGGIVELPERGRAFLTGVRTVRMQIPERIPLPGFTVDKLWRDLGLADAEVGERRHSGVVSATQSVTPAALAGRAAVAAANATDPSALDDIEAKASAHDLLEQPVAASLTREWAAQCPGVTPEVRLGQWIAACRLHLDATADSVVNAAAADADRTQHATTDTPATDGAPTLPIGDPQ
jgi:hypothetical protein